MRRVFAVIGFSSFFVSLFCIYFNAGFSLALGICAGVLFLISIFIKEIRKYGIFAVLLAAVCFSSLNCYVFDKNIEKYDSIYCKDGVKISGTLLDYGEVTDSGFKYVFRTTDENKVKFSVLSNDMINAEPGDVVSGTFDFSNQYADYSDRIYFSAYIYSTEDLKVEPSDNSFGIVKFRKALKQGISDNMSVGRGLTKAIVFGDKSGITDDLYNDLLRGGLLHATATSGLHLTVVTGFVFALLSVLGVSKKKSSVSGIIFIVLYMIVIGFKFSLMRAGIMMIMYFASNLFDREGDGINAIGMSITVLIAINPYTAVSCSFLLSASATLGMIFMFKPIYERVEKLKVNKYFVVKKTIIAFVCAALQSVSAILFTFPITYIFFGYFSAAGILANAILSPLISLILIFGVMICALNFIPVIPEIIGGANDMICLAVIKTAQFIGKFKYCLINIDYDFIVIAMLIVSFVIAASIIVYYLRKTDKFINFKITAFLCVDIMLLLFIVNLFIPNNDIELKVQNSGGGICVSTVIDNQQIVIDTGGKNCERKLNYEMRKNCVDKITMLIVPNSSDDAFSSAQTITSSFKVNKILIDTDSIDKDKYKISGSKENILDVDSVCINNLTLNIIKQQNSNSIYLTNGQVSVLIIDEHTDINGLPKKFKSCQTLIINGEIPNNLNKIHADNAIISTYEREEEIKSASELKTYNLRYGALQLDLSNEIKLKAV